MSITLSVRAGVDPGVGIAVPREPVHLCFSPCLYLSVPRDVNPCQCLTPIRWHGRPITHKWLLFPFLFTIIVSGLENRSRKYTVLSATPFIDALCDDFTPVQPAALHLSPLLEGLQVPSSIICWFLFMLDSAILLQLEGNFK